MNTTGARNITIASDSRETQLQRYFDILTRHVVPLFTRNAGAALQSCGSGLLVSNSQDVFLISAAHVFDEARREDLCFYAGVRTLRNVAGEILVTSVPPGKTRKNDRIDIGICRLRGEGLPPYPDINKVALPVTALMPLAYPRDRKQYLFTGFPASKSKANPHHRLMETKPYGTRCMSASKEGYDKVGFDPHSHIVVPFNHRKLQGRNGRTLFPEPVGISGSPLWLYFDEVHENRSDYTPVVGIVIEYHSDKCLLVATDIAAAIWLMNQFN